MKSSRGEVCSTPELWINFGRRRFPRDVMFAIRRRSLQCFFNYFSERDVPRRVEAWLIFHAFLIQIWAPQRAKMPHSPLAPGLAGNHKLNEGRNGVVAFHLWRLSVKEFFLHFAHCDVKWIITRTEIVWHCHGNRQNLCDVSGPICVLLVASHCRSFRFDFGKGFNWRRSCVIQLTEWLLLIVALMRASEIKLHNARRLQVKSAAQREKTFFVAISIRLIYVVAYHCSEVSFRSQHSLSSSPCLDSHK